MTTGSRAFKGVGIGFRAVALLAALAVILSSVGLPVVSTHPLGSTETEVWALLVSSLVAGLLVSAVGLRRQGAGADDFARILGALEAVLLVIGLLCALLILWAGVRARWIEVRDTRDLWWMFVVSTGAALFSATKGRAISRWFTPAERERRERDRRTAGYA